MTMKTQKPLKFRAQKADNMNMKMRKALATAIIALAIYNPTPETSTVTVIDLPDTITEARVAELVLQTLGDTQMDVTVKFAEILDPEAPYTSGIARKDGTIEIRSVMTIKGIETTIVHEVAHLLTRGMDTDPHGESWCEVHLNAMSEYLPEYAEQQTRFTAKRYGC